MHFKLVWFFSLPAFVHAILTQNAQVTADSIYWDPIFDIYGVNDGMFPTSTWVGGHKCAHTAQATPSSWINLQFQSVSLVETILLVDREDCCSYRIQKADFSVGFDPDPNKNTPCQINPQSSGVYSCKGLSGKYLGIFRDNVEPLNICQIRAYSWKVNQADYTVSSSTIYLGSALNLLTLNNPITTLNPFVTDTAPCYWQMLFSSERFIHAVVMVGHPYNNYAESTFFRLLYIDPNNNEQLVFDYSQDSKSRYGKEMQIRQFGLGVIFRKNTVKFSLQYVGVFTTMTDCTQTPTFTWSEPISIPNRVAVSGSIQMTVYASANDGDCPLAHYLTYNGSTVLPAFISFDSAIKTIKVAPTLPSQVGTHSVILNAVLADGLIQPITYTKTYTIEVYQIKMDPATAFTEKRVALLGNLVEIALPSYLPADAVSTLQLTYTGTNNFVSILMNSKVAIDTSVATPSTIVVAISVTDTNTQFTDSFQFTVVLYSCAPVNFILNPATLSVYTTQAATKVVMSWNPPEPACGTYNFSFDPSFSTFLSIAQPNISVQALANATAGSYSPTITMTNAINPFATATVTLNFTVITCTSSVQMNVIAQQNIICESTAKTIAVSLVQNASYCIETTNYALTQSNLNPLPAWVKQNPSDSSQIVVSGSKVSDAGTYQFTMTSTGTVSNLQNQISFTIKLVDCTIRNFKATPTAISISQLGPKQPLYVSKDPFESICTYEAYYNQATGALLTVTLGSYNSNSFTVYVQTGLSQPVGTTQMKFTWKITVSPNYVVYTYADVNVTRCEVLSISLSNFWNDSFYLIGATAKTILFPTFTQVPACQETMTYSVTSPSPLMTFDSATKKIQLFGSDLTQAGTFTISIQGTASVSKVLKTHTVSVNAIDCTPAGMLAQPSSISVSQLGPSLSTLLSKNQPASECGTYSYSIASQPSFIARNSNQITVTAVLTDKIGQYSVEVTETNALLPLSAKLLVPVSITPCQVLTMTKSISPIVPTQLIIGGPELPITMPTYTQAPDCKYEVLFKDRNENFDLSLSSGKWVLSTKPSTVNGLNQLSLRAYFNQTDLYDDLASIKIKCIKVQCLPMLPFTYVIQSKGSSPKTVSLVDQQSLQLSPEITVSQVQFNVTLSDGKPLPSWITFDPAKASFTIDVTDATLAGDYSILISVSAQDVHPGWGCKFDKWQITLQKDTSINKSIPVLNKLVLRPALMDQEVRPNDLWTYSVPTPGFMIEDASTKSKKVTLSIKTSSTLVQVNSASNTLILTKTITSKEIGSSVTVTYSLAEDGGTLTAQYTQQIVFKNLQVDEPTNSTASNNTTQSDPNSFEKSASIKQDPFKPFDPSLYYQYKPQTQNTQAMVQTKKNRPLAIEIKTISQTGIILVSFSEPLVVPMEYILKQNATNSTLSTDSTTTRARRLGSLDNALQVRIIPGEESDIKNLTYSWNVEEFTELSMRIKVTFDNAKYVSAHQELDNVQVIFYDLNSFQAQSGARLEKPAILVQSLPRQMQPDSPVVQIAQAATKGATGVKSFVIGNVILSTLLSASLNQLFSMVEAQQLVCLITCSQITLPPLSAVFISQFFQIANFDILNVGYVYEKIFYMPTLPALNANFAAVGFNDTYFINNLGSILLSIVGFLGLQALAMLFKKLKKKSTYFKAQWVNLQPTCFWNMPIRVILSSYSMLSLSSLMNLRHPQWKLPGPAIDTILSYLGLVLTLVFPPTVLYLMVRYFQDFEIRTFKASYGSLYDGLNTQSKWIIAFRVWFIVRRLLLSIIVVFVNNLTAQILLWFFQELLSLYILGYGYPFKNRSEWRSEMWNEAFILSTIYFTMFFSPYISNIDVLNGLGYSFCGLLFFHLILNIIIIAIFTIRQKLKEFKQWRIIRAEKLRMQGIKKGLNRQQLRSHHMQRIKRRLSMWDKGNNSLIQQLDRQETRRRSFAQGNLLGQDDKSRLQAAVQLLGSRNRTVNKSSILLEEIRESIESSSSSSSSLYTESFSIQEEIMEGQMEEIKQEESMTLNQIEDEEVGIQPLLRIRQAEEPKESKLELENQLILSQLQNEEVFSEQTEDRDRLLRIVTDNSKQTPFLSDKQLSNSEGDELVLGPRNEEHLNFVTHSSSRNKRVSLDELIQRIEQQVNTRYNSTIQEEEFLKELSNSRIVEADATKEQIDELDLLQRSVQVFDSDGQSPRTTTFNRGSRNQRLVISKTISKGRSKQSSQSSRSAKRKAEASLPYLQAMIQPEAFSMINSVDQLTKNFSLQPETKQLIESTKKAMKIYQAEPETRMLRQAVQKFTSMHLERRLKRKHDKEKTSKSLEPRAKRSKNKQLLLIENSDSFESSHSSKYEIVSIDKAK